MSGVDVGSEGGKRRSTNSDINMIPFIDLLMVTIAFLLITAVWVTNSRISTNADVPGREKCTEDCGETTAPVMHVTLSANDFAVSWKQASTVISETHVPRVEGSARYDDLAQAIAREWRDHRTHADPADKASDLAVLHTDDKTSFREIVGVLDAINSTQRDYRSPTGKATPAPAFHTTFAVR